MAISLYDISVRPFLQTVGAIDGVLAAGAASGVDLNELVTALLQDRDPFPNVEQSANWTSVGICAHQSALNGGEIVKVPDFLKR